MRNNANESSRCGVSPSVAACGAVLAAALLATSCGSDRVPVYPVSGQVFAGGKPAAGARVILHPSGGGEAMMRERPFGRVDAKGRFTLTTFVKNDGAPVGTFQVTIRWPGAATPERGRDGDSRDRRRARDRLDGRYRDPKTSGLTVTIGKGTNELPPFELE